MNECHFASISVLSPDGDHLQAVVFGPIAPQSRANDRRFYDDRVIVLKLDWIGEWTCEWMPCPRLIRLLVGVGDEKLADRSARASTQLRVAILRGLVGCPKWF